jgi:D-beta-D-heptose 7-phosphate kinase / D-beta-D-heptose 1-phosphate adenosyltransferase
MFEIEEALRRVPEQTIVCVGDVMLDSFVYGDVARISPEAPAPVIAVKNEERVIGGAGNVARNIASLGARCIFIGVVGDDDIGRSLHASFAQFNGCITSYLVPDPSRPTSRKVRFVSEHFSTHLLRADWELVKAVDPRIEATLIECVASAVPRSGAVVLSDYAKGVLTKGVIRATIAHAREHNIPVIVDPKGLDFSVYAGATVITPNRKELADATRLPVTSESDLVVAAAELARIAKSKAVLVKLSEDGMLLYRNGADPVRVSAYAVPVRDVSGAGDTVAAVFATMLALGSDLESAMRTANAAASVAVSKRGTATVSVAELRARMLPSAAMAPEDKIVFDWALINDRIAEWRRSGLRIGFTNGCFDLLHRGHVKVLAKAREACDRLVVGLNSDASVTRLKGKGRPIQDVHSRAEVLAALEAVDLVVVFEEETPIRLIERIRPKVLVKGGDYRPEDVVGRELIEAEGGEVVLVELVAGQSTSAIVRRSRSYEVGWELRSAAEA